MEISSYPTNDISRQNDMLKQLTMNSTNSDITVVQLRTIPKMMLKVILYAYTQSVFSGRKIEKSNDSIRMMWLSQNQNLLIKQLIDLE